MDFKLGNLFCKAGEKISAFWDIEGYKNDVFLESNQTYTYGKEDREQDLLDWNR